MYVVFEKNILYLFFSIHKQFKVIIIAHTLIISIELYHKKIILILNF